VTFVLKIRKILPIALVGVIDA